MARQQRVSRGAFGSEPKWRWRCRYPSRQGKRSSAYPVQVLARSECRTEHYSGDARNVANVSSRFQRRNCHVFRVNFGCEGACCWAWHSVYRTRELRRSEEHTSELQSPCNLVCRLLLEKKKHTKILCRPWRHAPDCTPQANHVAEARRIAHGPTGNSPAYRRHHVATTRPRGAAAPAAAL